MNELYSALQNKTAEVVIHVTGRSKLALRNFSLFFWGKNVKELEGIKYLTELTD